ncbi:presenilin-like protein At2g29900 [Ananas comosus]|uniref:Presenilin n=1 Tax=Ananas comosus TaxID=4615 RepID=A0A6P5FB83_ANACO|nr:presenilin-like protein At2g29900 [Ananas comosus]
MADAELADPGSVLDFLGEGIIRIVSPVSASMLLVVLLVSSLSSPSSSSSSPLFSITYSSSSAWDDLKVALLSSVAFVALTTLVTFVLVLLFYLRCSRLLRSYLALSSFVVFAFLGGHVSLLLVRRFSLPLDPLTFALLLLNLSVVGVAAVFAPSRTIPISLNQAYLVLIGVLVAYWFTLLPEWTTWALLIAMALYDLAAVLLPGGPLRLLVEIAESRDEEIPALIYEVRPVENLPRLSRRVSRARTHFDANPPSNSTPAPPGESPPPEMAVVLDVDRPAAEEPSPADVNAPLIEQRRNHPVNRSGEEWLEGIGVASLGSIKLGLGDFIFYSVLVGRAAMYDYTAVYACYLAIIAGLGVTLLLLGFFRQALPALPVSITLGVVFYVLTRELLEVFVVQCSTNLLMF